ncbi:hypothetical protein [Acinetobacter sp. P1(2025)]|uniref:hypothetical protein n=1 Tax=Acinetobacter sp. P1(2025) TaxID=3446120 RepID=UPI003F52E427
MGNISLGFVAKNLLNPSVIKAEFESNALTKKLLMDKNYHCSILADYDKNAEINNIAIRKIQDSILKLADAGNSIVIDSNIFYNSEFLKKLNLAAVRNSIPYVELDLKDVVWNRGEAKSFAWNPLDGMTIIEKCEFINIIIRKSHGMDCELSVVQNLVILESEINKGCTTFKSLIDALDTLKDKNVEGHKDLREVLVRLMCMCTSKLNSSDVSYEYSMSFINLLRSNAVVVFKNRSLFCDSDFDLSSIIHIIYYISQVNKYKTKNGSTKPSKNFVFMSNLGGPVGDHEMSFISRNLEMGRSLNEKIVYLFDMSKRGEKNNKQLEQIVLGNCNLQMEINDHGQIKTVDKNKEQVISYPINAFSKPNENSESLEKRPDIADKLSWDRADNVIKSIRIYTQGRRDTEIKDLANLMQLAIVLLKEGYNEHYMEDDDYGYSLECVEGYFSTQQGEKVFEKFAAPVRQEWKDYAYPLKQFNIVIQANESVSREQLIDKLQAIISEMGESLKDQTQQDKDWAYVCEFLDDVTVPRF